MELNDTTDYQQCFACGPHNPHGLRMVFSQEGETIISDFQPGQHHQGFPGVIHGGIIATLFDETLNRIVLLTKPPGGSLSALCALWLPVTSESLVGCAAGTEDTGAGNAYALS